MSRFESWVAYVAGMVTFLYGIIFPFALLAIALGWLNLTIQSLFYPFVVIGMVTTYGVIAKMFSGKPEIKEKK